LKKWIVTTLCLGGLAGSLLATSNESYAVEPIEGNSKANFKVTDKDPNNPNTQPGDGTLFLKNVPTFDFGVMEARGIYSGFTEKNPSADDKLVVSDTRLGASDWTVTAKMGKFIQVKEGGTDLTVLHGASLGLKSTGSLGESFNETIVEEEAAKNLVQGNGSHGDDVFVFAAADTKLNLGPNANVGLSKDDKFETTISWNLTSTKPTAPTA